MSADLRRAAEAVLDAVDDAELASAVGQLRESCESLDTAMRIASDTLTVAEEYAIWLAETAVDNSAGDDLNEGCDPITERGGMVSDEDWRKGMALAHRIAAWIRANPRELLGMVERSGVTA